MNIDYLFLEKDTPPLFSGFSNRTSYRKTENQTLRAIIIGTKTNG